MDTLLIEKAANAIKNARYIVITAGAGMGVDSGLPDFRGNEGFWKAYPALHGYSFAEMANPAWFIKDPHRAWGFYGHRLNLYRRTVPHDGFQILKKWVANKGYNIFTSNVDGSFQKAGFDSEKIVECHGSIHHVQLLDNSTEIWDASDIQVSVDESKLLAADPLPYKAGKLLRPNILMFGDWSWNHERTEEQRFRQQLWLQNIEYEDTVVIEMGAGVHIPTVRSFSQGLQRLGATLLRINPRDSHGPADTISIAMGAKAGLQAIDALIAK